MRVPWIIAHRGAAGHAPENTLAAFERAVELGTGFIETDLHLTRDGHFVAIHDGTLDRTTNGTGTVHEFTLADLRKVDAGLWYDRGYMGQRIPTLEEILEFGRNHDVVFYLEVKYEAAWGMHHALVAALQKSQSAARTIVISFDPKTIAAIRALDASLMVGILVEDPHSDPVKAALDVGARQLCLKFTLVTKQLVERAHAAGLQVVAWTVDQVEEMNAVIAAGVDGIMTDFPDRLRALLEDLAEQPPAQNPSRPAR
jgi:glycerophosphoryl diester phosphodiesterase